MARPWYETARTNLALYRKLVASEVAAALDELERQAESVLGAASSARTVARAGWVVQTIAEVADETKADLVVVARGKGGHLGRNAEGVVRMQGRAVLVAPIKPPTLAFLVPPSLQPRKIPSRRAAARSRR